MSLFKFAEQNIKECPELLLLSNTKNQSNFDTLTSFYKYRTTKYPIQGFLDILLNDTITRCSQNVIEYDLLKQKTRSIASLIQSKFDLQMSTL